MDERIEVRRTVPAAASEIFAVLCDPQGHVDVDASGMLMDATGEAVHAVGDEFVVHMDREALADRPLGLYDVTVHITTFAPDREIAWTIIGGIARPPIGHVYGYRLEPADAPEDTVGTTGPATVVTSYLDWSGIDESWRGRIDFPVIHPSSLGATLGILDRTVRRRRR